jgi:hypothetical protein
LRHLQEAFGRNGLSEDDEDVLFFAKARRAGSEIVLLRAWNDPRLTLS